MTDNTKLADLTVAEFRTLMQECFDADRAKVLERNSIQIAVAHYTRSTGQYPPQPWDEWFRDTQRKQSGFISELFGCKE
jgi:hypothetical protein